MPERDFPIPDAVLRLLWRGVELGVFIVLIAKDRRVPSWNSASPRAVTQSGSAEPALERRLDLAERG